MQFRGQSRDFKKSEMLYIGYYGWSMKKILGFRWSKETKITLETISFWQDISISICKSSPFLLRNLINFSKFTNALIKKEKKKTLNEKKKLRKVGLRFISGCFMKPFKMIINLFFYFSSLYAAQFWLFDIKNIKRGSWSGK